jgi:dTDP-4-dehydrorhamnose reductase
VTNTGDCIWHEFAMTIVGCMDLCTTVRPITTAQAGCLPRRLAYSVLAQKAGWLRYERCCPIGRMPSPDL